MESSSDESQFRDHGMIILEHKERYKSDSSGIQQISQKYLNLNLCGSENLPVIKEKYFNSFKTLLTDASSQDVAVDHLKTSSDVAYIIPELNLFFSSELKKTETLNLPILLKALNSLILNDACTPEDLCSYTDSLQCFLIKSPTSDAFHYLMKDIAADILCKLCSMFLTDDIKKIAIFYLSQALWNPNNHFENLYGSIVGCLSLTEFVSDSIHSDTFYSEILLKKVLNSPKAFEKLICLCGPFIHCCLPSIIMDKPLNTKNLLYDLNFSNIDLYSLIRNSALHSPIAFMNYDRKESKKSEFADLMFDEKELLNRLISATVGDDKEKLDFCKKLIEKHTLDQKEKVPKKLKLCDSLTNLNRIFEDYWDMSSLIKSDVDFHHVYLGYFCEESSNTSDEYCGGKSSVCQVSTRVVSSSSDMDPFLNLESDALLKWEYKRPSNKGRPGQSSPQVKKFPGNGRKNRPRKK